MKKRFMALALLCMLLCCGFAYASEPAVEVNSLDGFKEALENHKDHIRLTADIALDSSIELAYNVYIELNGHFIQKSSDHPDVKLIIKQGVQAIIGKDLLNVTSTDLSGGVKVDVENHGKILGSTAFYGTVTNDGEIGAQDCFYGEYVALDGSSNASYCITLTLDLNGYVAAPVPDGWEQKRDQLYQTAILRGTKLSKVLPAAISRTGYTFGG